MQCQNPSINVNRMSCIFHFHRILRAKSLYGTRQGKMKTGSSFWRNPFLPAHRVSNLKDEIRLMQSIADRPATLRGGKIESIRQGTAPVGAALKSSQTVSYPQNAANIPGVTVSIPAAGVDDHLRALEVALAIEQAQDDQAVIGNDVTVAAIFVITIGSGEFRTRGIPILLVSSMPIRSEEHTS